MALSLLPATALAAENGVYEVSNAEEWDNAINEIEENKDSVTKATIQLTDDVELKNVEEIGLEGVALTITSEGEGAPYLLTTKIEEVTYTSGSAWNSTEVKVKEGTLYLTGDMTFRNVHIFANVIYAEGHALVLDKGFQGEDSDGEERRMTVYGGSDENLTANTHVEVNDGLYKLIVGGNSAGTLTGNTYVEFGGSARFPTAADGEQLGDHKTGSTTGHNLYLDAVREFDYNPVMVSYTKIGYLPYGIYGGGVCGNTVGNTQVVMTDGEVFQIFGGGAARRNPSDKYTTAEEKEDSMLNLGRVDGSTSVTVTGGTVKSVYGGGYNDITVFSGDDHNDTIPADAREERAVVSGDTYVEIGGNTEVPSTDRSEDCSTSGGDFPAIYGGSFHSSVRNTKVVITGQAKIECGGSTLNGKEGYGVVFGGGCDDIVNGTTHVRLEEDAVIGNDQNVEGPSGNSKAFSALTPLGRSSVASYLNGSKGPDTCVIRNQGNETYAAVAEVAGGSVDILMASVRPNSDQYANTVNGNVQLVLSGGAVNAIEAGGSERRGVVINGDVDILVKGGTIDLYIQGHSSSLGQVPDPEPNIQGECTVTFERCGSSESFQMSPLIQFVDSVRVTEGSNVAVVGDHYVYDYDAKKQIIVPLWNVTNLTIDEGSTLAFEQDTEIEGNLVVNGALHLARSDGYTIPILGTIGAYTRTLTAGGTATGTGYLLPIEEPGSGSTDYGVYKEPEVNEEYVYADTDGSEMELTLAQEADGLYVARKSTDTEGRDVWYIAKGEDEEDPTPGPGDEEYRVIYTFECGTRGASLPDEVTKLLPVDKNTYAVGDTVKAIQPAQTSVEGPKNSAPNSPMGTWTFQGYTAGADKNKVTENVLVNVSDALDEDKEYISFTGTWVWTPKTDPAPDPGPTPGGGDDDDDDRYILRLESNGGTEFDDIEEDHAFTIDPYEDDHYGDHIPVRTGYIFTGWYHDRGLTQRIDGDIRVTGVKTIFAGWRETSVPSMLNGDDHYAYVIGFADGSVRPYANITRAQVATIFFRLLTEDVRQTCLTTYNTFPDVDEDYWANTAISTMAALGVINGRNSGLFDPDAPITRAEFAAICSRFDRSEVTAQSSLTDIAGHWAEEEIERAVALGWVQGFTDGTFRPNENITRAQAVTMINRVLNRLPETPDDLLPDMNTWTDCHEGDWFYLAMQEATNSHDYVHKDKVHERWTGMNADPDWKQYE